MAPAYRHDSLLGTGGMAEVWRARGPDGTVAIKRLLPHAARNASLAAAFEREGKLLARIAHPNVVAIRATERDEQGPYLVLEYVDGAPLRELCDASIAPRLALRVARDVLAALEAVHALRDDAGKPLGLVHRDLSPSNVLVSRAGAVKLTDFGIARALTGSNATTGQAIKGTLAYLSPEQASGASVDLRSDLFAVGALLYEMLAGAPIYDEDDPRLALARARAGDVAPLASVLASAPPELAELVDRALAAAPADRFPNAASMRAEVERVAERLGGLAADAEVGAWVHTVAPAKVTDSLDGAALAPPAGRRQGHRLAFVALAALATLAALVGVRIAMHPAPIEPAAAQPSSATVEARVVANTAPAEPSPIETATASAAASAPAPKTATARAAAGSSAARPAARPAPATIDIGSEPAFAYVAIDGVRVGSTPVFGRSLAPGVHRIEVSRDGLGSKSATVEVRSGEHVSRVFTLP